MDTPRGVQPLFRLYQAAQVKAGDRGFLSRDITVRELIEAQRRPSHFSKRPPEEAGPGSRGRYNQIANFVVAQSEINIAISNKEPRVYFNELLEQARGGPRRYGNITNLDGLRENLRLHCIPEGVENMTDEDFPDFLAERRKLMAQKMRAYFESL